MKEMRPLGNRVLIKQTRTETTKSGIIIAVEAQEKTKEAEVVAVGPDVEDVKIGDKVLFDKFAGTELEDNKSEVYTMIDADDILAVIQD